MDGITAEDRDYPDRASLRTRNDSRADRHGAVAAARMQPAEAACEELVSRYGFLVRSAAMRYRNSPEPAEDLIQVGYVGLLKAINNFDPAVGDSLTAYAQPCISGEIKRYFRDKRWQVRVRRSAQELRLRDPQGHRRADPAAGPDRPPTPSSPSTCLAPSEMPEAQLADAGLPGRLAGRAAVEPTMTAAPRPTCSAPRTRSSSTPSTWTRSGHTARAARARAAPADDAVLRQHDPEARSARSWAFPRCTSPGCSHTP